MLKPIRQPTEVIAVGLVLHELVHHPKLEALGQQPQVAHEQGCEDEGEDIEDEDFAGEGVAKQKVADGVEPDRGFEELAGDAGHLEVEVVF